MRLWADVRTFVITLLRVEHGSHSISRSIIANHGATSAVSGRATNIEGSGRVWKEQYEHRNPDTGHLAAEGGACLSMSARKLLSVGSRVAIGEFSNSRDLHFAMSTGGLRWERYLPSFADPRDDDLLDASESGVKRRVPKHPSIPENASTRITLLCFWIEGN